MDCCNYTQKANDHFGETRASTDMEQYIKDGLNSHSKAMVELVSTRNIQGAGLLEVGSGIGAVTLELLKKGAAQAVNVEASDAYLDAAKQLAGRMQSEERVTYHRADFTREAAQLPPADVVVMHRVVCCYPDAGALVTAAAQHSLHLLALSYPVDAWYMHLQNFAQNFVSWAGGSAFRQYIHSPQMIFEAAAASGLRPIRESSSGVWRLVLFERSPVEGSAG